MSYFAAALVNASCSIFEFTQQTVYEGGRFESQGLSLDSQTDFFMKRGLSEKCAYLAAENRRYGLNDHDIINSNIRTSQCTGKLELNYEERID